MSEAVRIEITNYCNRKCAYCFFNDRLTPGRDEMSPADFNYILDMCEKEDRKFVFIQGGEPTTHANFIGFINILKKRGFRYNLFSNGIFKPALLDELLIDKNDEILINFNHPSTLASEKEWELVNKNLARMTEKGIQFSIGYNLYQSNPDYGYFIDAIRKYKIPHIRWDLARPSAKFTNTYFSFDDLFKMTPVMVKFIKAYMNEGCPFAFDCPIPVCMILRKEFEFINSKTDVTTLTSHCGALLNIGPGLNMASCPAGVSFKDITLRNFESISQAETFFNREVDRVRWGVWYSDKCDDCIYRLMRECQGGCIGHKRLKEDKVIGPGQVAEFLREYRAGAQEGVPGFIAEQPRIVPAEHAERCLKRCERELKEAPNDPYTHYSLGRSCELLENYDGAIKAYDGALAQDGGYLIAKNRLNLVYQLKGVKINPGNVGAWTRLESALKQITGDKSKRDLLLKQYKARYSK